MRISAYDRIVNYLIQDGKSNYLEGGLLMAVYLVLSSSRTLTKFRLFL